ncbi:Zinc finger CCCH domain-containing protein 65 [Striga hermonthica]|uniref:Zinc finger CCCH domain-containing protein 65 n=1 Tax=Striga hermonthica TaxID=68872 RepID=A0A9N7RS97_STRHE|nr:Zinc finger CCCH domain-containing protein 65 [Striga hermonthica]
MNGTEILICQIKSLNRPAHAATSPSPLRKSSASRRVPAARPRHSGIVSRLSSASITVPSLSLAPLLLWPSSVTGLPLCPSVPISRPPPSSARLHRNFQRATHLESRERSNIIETLPMEDSSLQSLTLNPSDAAFSFPPHRRRPLRSRTFCALVGIITNTHKLRIQGDGGALEVRSVREEDGATISNEDVHSEAAVIPLPVCKQQSEDTLVRETSISEKKVTSFQYGDSERNQATTPELDHGSLGTDGRREVAPENSVSNENLSIVVNQTSGCAIQVSKEQEENASKDVLGHHMENLVALEELQVDEEFSVADYSDVLDSCFGVDMTIESSKTVLEENMSKETEHELQLKEMELEKLINFQNADHEFEEGEISGEVGVADVSFHEEPSLVGDRTVEIVHASEDVLDKEESMSTEEYNRGFRQHQAPDPLLARTVNSDYNSVNIRSRQIAGVMQGKAAESQMCATVEKDGDGKRKKRKNGPLTEEKRAKKKRKDRLKRAEKNRKLGVKRLKLQPVKKQKTITYCRHFLHGRCHEGEKCKFSHDTVPLTKSKPCGHFARHSCMKGDDCPYDHQLSKYPCNNYTTNGFCSRGSDCLFSHEVPAQTPSKASALSSKVNHLEVNFLSSPNNSNPSKHTDDNRGKSLELELPFARTVPKTTTTARQAPKGISFISNVRTSLGGTTNRDVVIASCSNEPNEKPESVPQKKPRGINFLSFAQPTATTTSIDNSSSNNILSKLLPSCSPETRKSIMAGLGESKAVCSSLDSVGVSKVNNNAQMNKSFTSSPSEKVDGNFSSLPSKLSVGGQTANTSVSFRTPFLSNTPSSVQKAVQSTLAFAANGIRVAGDRHFQNFKALCRENFKLCLEEAARSCQFQENSWKVYLLNFSSSHFEYND